MIVCTLEKIALVSTVGKYMLECKRAEDWNDTEFRVNYNTGM